MAFAPVERETKNLCRQLGLTPQLLQLEQAWEAEMGGWGRMARLVAIDHSSLVVEVSSSPAMQEISLRRQELVRRLNRHFDEPFIRQITIKVATES